VPYDRFNISCVVHLKQGGLAARFPRILNISHGGTKPRRRD
jgi:hypothetical protein